MQLGIKGKTEMNLAGMTFRAVANSENGSLNTETEMHFDTDDGIVTGGYSGGTISTEHVLAKHLGDSELEMLYQGVTIGGKIQAGRAKATFSQSDDNKMHMYLDWQWLTEDRTKGHSEWIHVNEK
ncbi:MAG: hypothetical protein O7G83_12565 [Proteobacteria bacterium]|nr:hypothetical protein [Pseudomonadota bacterium]